MLGLLVLVASFLFFFISTIVFPSIPPGQIVVDFFRNSETNYTINGVSGESLVSAIINGLVWSVIILIIYSYLRGPKKDKTSLPVWVPGYAKSRNSKKGGFYESAFRLLATLFLRESLYSKPSLSKQFANLYY